MKSSLFVAGLGVLALSASDYVAAQASGTNGTTVLFEIDYDGVNNATILLSVFLSIVVLACCVCCSCFYRVSLLQRTLRMSRATSAATGSRNRQRSIAANMAGVATRSHQESDEGWGDIGRDGAFGFQSAILQAGYASFAGGASESDDSDGDEANAGDVESQRDSSSSSSSSRREHRTQREQAQAFHTALIKQIQRGIIVSVVCVFIVLVILGPVMLVIGAVCLANDLGHKGICGPAGYMVTTGSCDAICEDSCAFAFDGVCNDGRAGAPSPTLCSFGTDCADCSENCEIAIYSMTGGALYVAFGCIFVIGLIVLLYYLVVGSQRIRERTALQRKKPDKLTTCSNCAFQYNADFEACTMCGTHQTADLDAVASTDDGSTPGSRASSPRSSPTALVPILPRAGAEVRMSPVQLSDGSFIDDRKQATAAVGMSSAPNAVLYHQRLESRSLGDGHASQAFWAFHAELPVNDRQMASAVERVEAAAAAGAAAASSTGHETKDGESATGSDANTAGLPSAEKASHSIAEAGNGKAPMIPVSSEAVAASSRSEGSGAELSARVPSLCLGMVRQLTPAGELRLVSLEEGFPAHDFQAGGRVVTARELTKMRRTKFGVKMNWFRALLSDIGSSAKYLMVVSRESLLRDSLLKIMRAGPRDMQKMLRVRFLGEDAIDAGGVQREWFELLAQQIFDPEARLFVQSRPAAVPASAGAGTGVMSAAGVTYDIVGQPLSAGRSTSGEGGRQQTDGVVDDETTKDASSGDDNELQSPDRPAPPHPFQAAIANFMEVTGVTDVECATTYVEHANGNAPVAIGMYFDGVEIPYGFASGISPGELSASANSFLLTPGSARGQDVGRRGGGGGGANSAVSQVPLTGSARFMEFLQQMISGEAGGQSAGGGGAKTGPAPRVISGGPLRGLDAADCYRCIGYFLGKAILERQTIPAYLSDYILRHIVGSPVGINDLRQVDPGMYGVFFDTVVAKNGDEALSTEDDGEGFDFEEAGLDFSMEELDSSATGGTRFVDLKPGGRDISVTNDNKYEYIALALQYKLGGRVSIELGALLVGFYSVIPHQLISVFLISEVQLLLAGLPQIDVRDWRFNTLYKGCKESSRVAQWFWSVLEEMTNQERSRLLQFVTGTARVPVGGLAALQGHDGHKCPFTLKILPRKPVFFPEAHTCFNALYLPEYKDKDDLRRHLLQLVKTDVTGFNLA